MDLLPKSRRGAANISNIFAAVLAFMLGAIMLYCTNDIIMFFININGNIFLRMIETFSYICLTLLIMFYFPIHILTSEDSQAGKRFV